LTISLFAVIAFVMDWTVLRFSSSSIGSEHAVLPKIASTQTARETVTGIGLLRVAPQGSKQVATARLRFPWGRLQDWPASHEHDSGQNGIDSRF
jgi:hypothetical protein